MKLHRMYSVGTQMSSQRHGKNCVIHCRRLITGGKIGSRATIGKGVKQRPGVGGGVAMVTHHRSHARAVIGVPAYVKEEDENVERE